MTRLHRALLLLGFMAGLAAVSLTGWLVTTPDEPPRQMGWTGPESLQVTEAWTASQPQFSLTDPRSGEQVWQDNANVRVVLWEDLAQVNGGQIPENVPQQTGDCTPSGGAHAIEATQGSQCARGPPQTFRRISRQFLYGAARVWIAKGRWRNTQGCSGASVAQAAQLIGALPEGTPGLPPYDGRTADRWGITGPPESLKAEAAKHKVRSVALARSVNDVRDAICNRFGVTISSNAGFEQRSMRPQDGRIVAHRDGQWMHTMCIDGYDGTAASGKKYFHVLNSWGPDAHPKPIDGSPPGGFWIEEHDLADIVAQQDSWIYSDFEGFPAEIDLAPLRPRPGPR